jgi:hypothetical protein
MQRPLLSFAALVLVAACSKPAPNNTRPPLPRECSGR